MDPPAFLKIRMDYVMELLELDATRVDSRQGGFGIIVFLHHKSPATVSFLGHQRLKKIEIN